MIPPASKRRSLTFILLLATWSTGTLTLRAQEAGVISVEEAPYQEIAVAAVMILAVGAALFAWQRRRAAESHAQAMTSVAKQLEQSQERYRSLVERNLAGVFRTTEDGRVLECNEAIARMLGYASRQELLAQDASSFFPEPSDREEYLAALRKQGTLTNFEMPMRRKDGSLIWILENVSLLQENGSLVLEGTMIDINELKQLEAELRQVQKMEALGQLAEGIAHDFNNLLQVISGYTEILEPGMGSEDSIRMSVAEIRKAVTQGVGLTCQLLAFGRKDGPHPEVLNLNLLLTEAEQMLRSLLGPVELVTTFDPGIEMIAADPTGIVQVVMNLAVNARDAMPEGGKLLIRTAQVFLDHTLSTANGKMPPGPYVALQVSDTGVGMNERIQSRIFEPFFTTKEKGKGTGLGLSAVYGIVKQSGGYIHVLSKPCEGSTFTIYWPSVIASPQEPEQSQTPALPRGTETVLLVEDEEAVRKLARRMLELSGYTVLEAERAEEAIRLFEAEADRVDLLLTDVVMPGMDGAALAKQLTGRAPGLRVLYMSGRATQPESGSQGGFLQKPFTGATLLSSVRQVLDGPHHRVA